MKKLLLFISILFFCPFVFALSYENGVYVTNSNVMQAHSYIDDVTYTITPGQNVTAHNITMILFDLTYNIQNGRYYQLEVNLTRSILNSPNYHVSIHNSCVIDGVDAINSNYPKFNFHCNSDLSEVGIAIFDEYDAATLITTEGTFFYNYAFLRYATDYAEQTYDRLGETNDKLDDINDSISDSTQEIIDSQKVCQEKLIDRNYVIQSNKIFNSSGVIINADENYGITDYIKINDATVNVVKRTGYLYSCYYQEDKTLISCFLPDSVGLITPPNNAYYIRASIHLYSDTPQFNIKVCKNGNQAIQDTLTDDNINNNVISNFFSNFQNNDHGLSSIITAPLSAIQGMASATCTPLVIPIPFTNSNITIPCMSSYYNTYIPQIYSLWQTITFGIISYFICVDIYKMVKGFKDPESDKVEVLDL